MVAQSAEATSGESVSDLAQLWQTAVEEYEKKTKKTLRLTQFKNMDDVMKGNGNLSNEFKDFRHDKSKVDKVRTAFRNNLWLIQKVVNTVQVVGNVASAFPPAMPASLIFAAFGHVMQSFADVSADYDKVMGFFDFTHRFFDRLSMIEDKTPQLGPFQRCVTWVFSSMLEVCSTAQEYATKKRLKKWFEVLVEGSDGALDSANKTMESAVNELSQAVGLATLRTVDVLNEVVHSMNGQVEFLVSKYNIIDERTEAIQSNTGTIIEQNKDLGQKQDEMMKIQSETLEKLTEQSRMFNDTLGYFESVQMGENFGENFKTSLLKLDVVRLRLTRWGQSIGLANVEDVASLEKAKILPEDIPQVEDLLSQILDLFEDAEKMSKRAKKRAGNSSIEVLDPDKELDGVEASLHQKMYDLAKKRQGNTESQPSAQLTLFEEKSFTRLIEDIGELINGLVELFPAIQEAQRKLCEEEVSAINPTEGAMPLLKEIADGQDKLLSEAVIKIIESSSTTTYNNSVVFSGPNSGFQIGNNSGKINNVRFH